MPIYEYQCRKYGKQFEAFQGITGGFENMQILQGQGSKDDVAVVLQLEGQRMVCNGLCGKKPQTVNPKSTETATAEVLRLLPMLQQPSKASAKIKCDTSQKDQIKKRHRNAAFLLTTLEQ